MSDIVGGVITLGEYFAVYNGCVIDGVRHAGVVKTIQKVTETTKDSAKSVWLRMKQKYPMLEDECVTHKFEGKTGDVVVANAATLMKIIFNLRSAKAQEFRESSMQAFLEVLNPTPEFIEALQDRQANMEDADDDDGIVVSSVPRGPRAYAETNVYVRVRVPHEHTHAVTILKEMTMERIKFGVAYDMQGRHFSYPKDNGYFAFAFMCRSRQEAELAENYIKGLFGSLTVLNSREYLDARRLAAELGVEYDGKSYEQYLVVARTLFVKMVEFIKLVYPGVYDGVYGTLYSVVETMHDLATAEDLAAPTRIYFTADTITRELAIQFGFRNPTTTWKPVAAESGRMGLPKSNGPVISYHLVTGKEMEWPCVERAAKMLRLGAKNVRSSVDVARHCGGYMWRTPSAKKWVVPEGLIIDPTKHEGAIAYVKGVDSDGQVVFENAAIAARALGLAYSSIDNAVGLDKVVAGKVWSLLTESESSTFSESVNTSAPRATFVTVPENGADGRTECWVVARDLATGEETAYKSKNNASALTGVRGDHITELLDKPMQAYGKIFRRYHALERWEPPSYFMIRTEDKNGKRKEFENKCSPQGYVVSLDIAGTVTGLYESKTAAAHLAGIDRTSLNKVTQASPQTVKGVVWRMAVPDDYMTFVPCAPPPPPTGM
jgi:hypothetical protein